MLTDEQLRRDFPALIGRVYLNTAAESVPPICVGQALNQYWQDKLLGMDGRVPHFAQVELCRETAARHLSLQPTEVSFCSCSSEAYNLLASALNLTDSDEVVINELDFPAGATPWLCGTNRPMVRLWQAKDGTLSVSDLEILLTQRTRLVQVSLVSFYNGYRLDWKALHDTVRRFAPQAILAVDVTQALGRCVLDCSGADIVISSTHKWTLGVHGGCIIGIPEHSADKLTTNAGGWLHIQNAFNEDRFQRAEIKKGAASYSVGMPNFAAIYALNAALRYLEEIGIERIARHADPLVALLHATLVELGITPLAPAQPGNSSGIVAFRHIESAKIAADFAAANIHVMHHAGRIRFAIHGYNRQSDIEKVRDVLRQSLNSLAKST